MRRVLMVTAHPDDVDFGSAGTVAAFTWAGLEVTYCVATNGDAGGSDLDMVRADMAALRQEEQRAAAAVAHGRRDRAEPLVGDVLEHHPPARGVHDRLRGCG